jgi:hypothetical protein
VELLKKTFPKWNNFDDPLGLWRWKYINTPQRTLIIVAVADNKIVGCYHSLVYNAKLGSEITSLGYSDDLAIDTDYRGLGIFPKLEKSNGEILATLAKYHFYSAVNPIIVKSWIKYHRAVFPFPVTRMIKTNDIDLQLQMRPMKNSLLVKLGYIFLKYLNMINSLFRTPIKHSDEFEITRISEFDEGIDSFWEKVKDDYSFILEKKHEYLNWRFSDNSRGNHIKFQVMSGDEILGYAVIGYKEGHIEGLIVDLLALKDRLDVADALLDHVCEFFDGTGIKTVFYQVVEGHPYQMLFKRKGFIDSRSRPNITFDYTEYWNKESEVPFLEHTAPSQVYFNYAETV